MSLRAELLLVPLWALCCRGALAVNGNPTEPYSLRLAGRGGRCQGRLQVQRAGQDWTGVNPMSVPLWFGQTVCLELDCGAALTATEQTVPQREAVYVVPGRCEHDSLIDCFHRSTHRSDYALELNCSDSVRLVGGRSLCSGPLQIRDQSWASVCEGALGRRGAEVLCRELGCGAPRLQVALSPLGQTFHCEGHESKLMDCPRNQTRTGSETCPTLQLTCSEPLRLAAGSRRCEGAVELQYKGEWRRVVPALQYEPWDLEAAAGVCRSLGCGSAVSTEERDGSDVRTVWRVNSACARKASVRDCVEDARTTTDGLHVRCSDSVRLVGGRSLCSGSLQVQDQSLAPSWASVCEGALGRRGAEVLCRELGCGAPLLQGALSPLGQTFHCEGHESKLMDCPRNQTRTGPETCPTLQLTCEEPLRLVGGPSRCEGTLELKFRGEWRPVVTFEPLDRWDFEAAVVACRSLECGAAVSAEKREVSEPSAVWKVNSACVRKNSSVKDCVWVGFTESVTLHVMCSGH